METVSGSIYHLQMRERSPRTHEAEALDPERLGLWMGTDAQLHDASVEIHSGMFQDSYLIRSTCRETEKAGNADIRFFAIPFFPAWARLEPYHISKGIKSLLVRNEGCTNIAVGSESKNILCLPGMTTSIPIRDQSCNSGQLNLF